MELQIGWTDSVHLKTAMRAVAQGAAIAVCASHCETQVGAVVEVGHAAAANLAQKVEQEEASRAGEQLLPHWARLPASPSERVVAPPQATFAARPQAKNARARQ